MSSLMEYKCPSCSGALNFDTETQSLKCPYCDTVVDLESAKAYDEDLNNVEEKEIEWDNYNEESGSGDWQEGEQERMNIYVCQSCAGEIITEENVSGTNCPYCGNPVIMKSQFAGSFRPDYVIPFKLDKETAKTKLKEFMKGKPLLPKFFEQDNHIDEIKGVYVPFWLFDCDTDAKIRYKGTKIRAWSDSNYQYTRTDFYSIIREGVMNFEKVPVDGSTKMDDAYMESIEPFDYSGLVEFQTAYLAGLLTNKYDVDADKSIPRANERIRKSVIKSFEETINGYSSCIPESMNVQLNKGKISYALLPVWLLSSTYKGKIYSFAMNGQTGKFVGELPVDKGRMFGIFMAIFGGLTIILSTLALLL